jgi:hypothetical protein
MGGKTVPIAMAAAVALAGSAACLAPAEAAAGMKMVRVHGDPKIVLVLTPNYLPDGKVEEDVRLVNRSDQDYCFRFEVYDDQWVHAPRRVSIVTAPPRSAYQVVKLRIYAAGAKYRYKFKGMYLKDAGIEGRDCRKAFPKDREY